MARTLITEVSDTIPHPIEEVWSLASAFGSIKSWMPSIESCVVDGKDIGAIRTVITHGSSIPVKEQLAIWDHDHYTISYRLLDPIPLPMRGGFGTVSLKSLDSGTTKVTWRSDAEDVSEEGIRDVGPIFAVFIKDCLTELKQVLGRPARAAASS
ncbi:hypothetical protein VTL71DRAFT_6856 [Oculimacula yallundae]|uniref:Polyketide cyclase / dehydrase and lipid transport n=1 Tax=Oculimacula yallundae TaxID=86028 RepID=A0ABR4BV23_9HELO